LYVFSVSFQKHIACSHVNFHFRNDSTSETCSKCNKCFVWTQSVFSRIFINVVCDSYIYIYISLMVSEQFSYKGLYIFSVSFAQVKLYQPLPVTEIILNITYIQSYLEGDVLNVMKLEKNMIEVLLYSWRVGRERGGQNLLFLIEYIMSIIILRDKVCKKNYAVVYIMQLINSLSSTEPLKKKYKNK
jgi:hypothetical protein